MGSSVDARRLIDTIRREKTLNGTIRQNSIFSVVQNALKILSEQLYDKSTHFLLELLQNADDNAYQCQTPTFNLTYRPGSLRVDCNEVGFSDQNVKAICDIGESTKKGLNRSGGYIGEKGIGFKSVFKVADVVWISSRQFNFKFDRSQDLGMIAPLWEDFPEPTIPGYTSFLIKIAEDYDEEELKQDIISFDPTLLIFLRRVREIHLSVTKNDGSTWSTRISRADTWELDNLIITLNQEDSYHQYLVTKHIVNHIGHETKRADCSESELLLAFPISTELKKVRSTSQNVYAFLPIRDYGFKFLLQSDFLLTANREEIDKSSVWNCTLRDAAVYAFTDSIDRIIAGPSKYDWLHFVPAKGISPFFLPVQQKILKSLAQKPVLESWGQIMSTPSTLFYVPKYYSDNTGVPFSLNAETSWKYLSVKYPDSEIETLQKIGVKILEGNDFLVDLRAMIERDHDAFRSRSWEWHAQLAGALLPLLATDSQKETISSMRIIPLRNGKWITAAGNDLFFSTTTKIPEGIPLHVIAPSAQFVVNRYNLFQRLGARDCDDLRVCRMIAKMHGQADFDATSVFRAQLISHARFLYEASWQTEGAQLWFVTKKDQRRHGSELYLRRKCRKGSPMSLVYEQMETQLEFLHDDYLDMPSTDEVAWTSWLEKTVGVSTIPRLVNPPRLRTNSSVLSKDFKLLFQHCSSRDLLWVIRDHWSQYSRWLEHDDVAWQADNSVNQADRSFKDTLQNELKDQKVKCRIGQLPLSKAVLPMLDQFLDLYPLVPSLDIYDPLSPSWKILRHLGVAVERNAEYYIRCLEALRNTQPLSDVLTHIYSQLMNNLAHEGDFIQMTFIKTPLIYASSKTTHGTRSYSWHTTADCVIKGLRPDIDHPRCSRLFHFVLMTNSSGLDTLLTRLSFLDQSIPLSEIARLFRDTSNAIREANRTRPFILPQNLVRRLIFPINRKGTPGKFDYLAPLGLDMSWFIADRYHLKDGFNGKIPLLAFTPEELGSMEHFLRSFQLGRRQLSLLVRTQTIPRGLTGVHRSYTSFLKERAPFIQALIPKTHPALELIGRQIANVQASTAAEIVVQYTLRVGFTEISGTSENGELASSSTNEMLQLFMTEECISADCPSFDLIELIADHCSINNPKHRSLIYTALSDENSLRIQTTFRKQGLHVDIVVPEDDSFRPETLAKRYAGASGDLPTIPSPFNARKGGTTFNEAANYNAVDDERADGIRLTTVDHLLLADEVRPNSRAEKTKSLNMKMPFSSVKAEDGSLSRSGYVYWPINGALDTNVHYLGELMMSQYFQSHLGPNYEPNTHWTSRLRTRAGNASLDDQTDHASFTFAGEVVSSQITQILARYGYPEATSGRLLTPTYHFEVAVTLDDQSDSFHLHIAQFERMRRYYFDPNGPPPKHVVILARLSNIYSNLRYEFYVNPWRLYTSNNLSLHGQCSFEVKLAATSVPVALGQATQTSPSRIFTSLELFTNGALTPPYSSSSRASFSEVGSGPLIVSHTMLTPDWKPNLSRDPDRLLPILDPSLSPLQVGSTIVAIPKPGNILQRYSYCSLQTEFIRLLQLLPGSDDESLRGIIFHVPLESAVHFRALSYVWGTMTQSEALWTPDGVLGITPNLKAALQHLRQKQDSLVLWVDAICINQQDVVEKSSQIRFLPHIFQRAASVFAFLGNSPQNQRALETLMQIRAKGAVADWPKCLPPVPLSWNSLSVPSPQDTVWADIHQFFQNPWFRRAWVIQEVVLAASVRIVCGNWIVDWNDLLIATQTVDRECRRSTTATANVCPWEFYLELAQHREWEARQTRWALINLLEPFRYLEASWTRDRLFALLGFASDGADPAFEPDYTVPLEAVVTRFAGVFIKQGKVLQLLYRASLGSQPSRFPSWVPDWTTLKPPSLYEASAGGKQFCASWIAEPYVEHDAGSDELRVRGFRLDTLQHVTSASNVPEQWGEYWQEIDAMMDVPMIKTVYPQNMRDEMKWKVPIAGALFPRTMGPGNLDLEVSYDAFRRNLAMAKLARFENDPAVSEEGNNYALALGDNIYGWKFFTTQRGLVGLGPPSSMAGDLVYVFNGGGVPFLIRRSATRAGAYRLIGECYVHGLMDGEGGGMGPVDEGLVCLH